MLLSAPPSSTMSDIHQTILNKHAQTITQQDATEQFQLYLTKLSTALGKFSLNIPEVSALQHTLLPLLIVLDNPTHETVQNIAFNVALIKKAMPHLDNECLLDRFLNQANQTKPKKSK